LSDLSSVRVFQIVAEDTVEDKVLEIQAQKEKLIAEVSPTDYELLGSLTHDLTHVRRLSLEIEESKEVGKRSVRFPLSLSFSRLSLD